MTSLTQVDCDRHRLARVDPARCLAAAAGASHARITLGEIASAAADYPLVFVKSEETGRFAPVALFGLEPGRSLFAVGTGAGGGTGPVQWNATYLPATVLRYPFALGQEAEDAAPVLCVDEAALGGSGHPLFAEDGGESPYLRHMRDVLARAHADLPATDRFVAALLERGLIRPLDLGLTFADGRQSRVEGLYAVSPPRLRTLPDADVLTLHRNDWLAAAVTMAQSLAQLNRLQQLHNATQGPRLVRIEPRLDV